MHTSHRLLVSLLSLVSLASLTSTSPAGAASDGAARDRGRSIQLDAELDAPPGVVFELWSTPAGVRRFFAADARIDPRVGGRYEILFNPAGDPTGERDGTKGARILRWEPGRALSFEWKGRAEMVEMNVRPLPTWVELSFAPLGNRRTRLHLAHHGFGEGGGWDDAYAFFSTAWRSVLGALEEACAGRSPEPRRSTAAAVVGRLRPARTPALDAQR
jgi:uncharacterized protein YndB with AHSA1/START domain